MSQSFTSLASTRSFSSVTTRGRSGSGSSSATDSAVVWHRFSVCTPRAAQDAAAYDVSVTPGRTSNAHSAPTACASARTVWSLSGSLTP